jgi:patatin-like phospholipase/acyl hydrolase
MATQFRILSIDGGGLRGLIPLLILKELENYASNSLSTTFDLYAGTSTGGLITCGLTASENGINPKFNLEDIIKIYTERGKEIFPIKNTFRNYFSWLFYPQYSNKGLVRILDEKFDQMRISNCLKPILITSYDLTKSEPLIFKSRYTSRGSSGYEINKNAKIRDILLATSAAPTYLKSHDFLYHDSSATTLKSINCIDGGVYVNNPSLLAISEILDNCEEPIYNVPDLNLSEIGLLSLGTGEVHLNYNNWKTNLRGKLMWSVPAIKIMMSASSQINHYQSKSIIQELGNYLRINIMLTDSRYTEMTCSSLEFFEYLEEQVQEQLLSNDNFLEELSEYVLNTGI